MLGQIEIKEKKTKSYLVDKIGRKGLKASIDKAL